MTLRDVVAQRCQDVGYETRFSEFIELQGRGDGRMALCCFHLNTDTPALSLNVRTGLFQCKNQACDAHGDFFAFYGKARGISFPETLRQLAGRFGINTNEYPVNEEHRDWLNPLGQSLQHDVLIDEAVVTANGAVGC